MDTVLRGWVAQVWVGPRRLGLADEAGEGVISTAIAVLIIALIGAAMWFAFNEVFSSASEDIRSNVEKIK
ncbi:MAG: hypothetical protein ACRDZ9_05940 [Acidimicrobiales bacterium]